MTWNDQYTTLDRWWGIRALQSWEIMQGTNSCQKSIDPNMDYERLCMGLFNDTGTNRVVSEGGEPVPGSCHVQHSARPSRKSSSPVADDQGIPLYTAFTKINNLMFAPANPFNANGNAVGAGGTTAVLFHCRRNIPFWGSLCLDQAVPINMVSPQNFLNFNFVFNGPSYFVRNWGLTSVSPLPLVNFTIVNPRLHFSFQSIAAALYAQNFPITKSITYQLPDFQRLTIPNFLFAASGGAQGGTSSYKIPITNIGCAARSILVCFRRQMDVLGQATSNGNQGVLFRNCENWANPLKPQIQYPTTYTTTAVAMTPQVQGNVGMDMIDIYFASKTSGMKLFVPPGNMVIDSAMDQLFVNREMYYVKNHEDTMPLTKYFNYNVCTQPTRDTMTKYPRN